MFDIMRGGKKLMDYYSDGIDPKVSYVFTF